MKPLFFRAWRQKIEAWLQENEKEEKQNEELKRRSRRVQSNRRSLEADSGKYQSYVWKQLFIISPVFNRLVYVCVPACVRTCTCVVMYHHSNIKGYLCLSNIQVKKSID
jgi:hypothetical protein